MSLMNGFCLAATKWRRLEFGLCDDRKRNLLRLSELTCEPQRYRPGLIRCTPVDILVSKILQDSSVHIRVYCDIRKLVFWKGVNKYLITFQFSQNRTSRHNFPNNLLNFANFRDISMYLRRNWNFRLAYVLRFDVIWNDIWIVLKLKFCRLALGRYSGIWHTFIQQLIRKPQRWLLCNITRTLWMSWQIRLSVSFQNHIQTKISTE